MKNLILLSGSVTVFAKKVSGRTVWPPHPENPPAGTAENAGDALQTARNKINPAWRRYRATV